MNLMLNIFSSTSNGHQIAHGPQPIQKPNGPLGY